VVLTAHQARLGFGVLAAECVDFPFRNPHDARKIVFCLERIETGMVLLGLHRVNIPLELSGALDRVCGRLAALIGCCC